MRKNEIKIYYFVTIFLLSLIVSGCVTGVADKVSKVDPMPKWTKQGSGFYMDENSSAAIYGVGMLETTNPDGTKIPRSLVIRAAEARARASIINTLNSNLSALTELFQYADEENNKTEIQQLTQDSVRQTAEGNLKYTPMIDSYYSESEGMQYVLVKYSPELYQAMVENVDGISNSVKKSVKANAKAVFEEMAKMSKSNNQ